MEIDIKLIHGIFFDLDSINDMSSKIEENFNELEKVKELLRKKNEKCINIFNSFRLYSKNSENSILTSKFFGSSFVYCDSNSYLNSIILDISFWTMDRIRDGCKFNVILVSSNLSNSSFSSLLERLNSRGISVTLVTPKDCKIPFPSSSLISHFEIDSYNNNNNNNIRNNIGNKKEVGKAIKFLLSEKKKTESPKQEKEKNIREEVKLNLVQIVVTIIQKFYDLENDPVMIRTITLFSLTKFLHEKLKSKEFKYQTLMNNVNKILKSNSNIFVLSLLKKEENNYRIKLNFQNIPKQIIIKYIFEPYLNSKRRKGVQTTKKLAILVSSLNEKLQNEKKVIEILKTSGIYKLEKCENQKTFKIMKNSIQPSSDSSTKENNAIKNNKHFNNINFNSNNNNNYNSISSTNEEKYSNEEKDTAICFEDHKSHDQEEEEEYFRKEQDELEQLMELNKHNSFNTLEKELLEDSVQSFSPNFGNSEFLENQNNSNIIILGKENNENNENHENNKMINEINELNESTISTGRSFHLEPQKLRKLGQRGKDDLLMIQKILKYSKNSNSNSNSNSQKKNESVRTMKLSELKKIIEEEYFINAENLETFLLQNARFFRTQQQFNYTIISLKNDQFSKEFKENSNSNNNNSNSVKSKAHVKARSKNERKRK